MELNTDATFEGKLTCAFKHDIRNLAHFHQSMFGSLKIGTLMASFCLKLKVDELKIYRGSCKNDAKIEEEFTCQFKIDMKNLTNFDPSTGRSQKFAI